MNETTTVLRARWTPETDAVLTAAFQDGVRDQALSEALGISKEAVRHRRIQLRLTYRPHAAPKWTPDMDQTLITMRDAGYSASIIGDRLGTTRGAVLGRADRLNLPRIKRGYAPISKREAPKPRPRPVTRKMLPFDNNIVDVIDALIPAEQRRTIFELTADTCRWPVGDPCKPDFFYCGAGPARGFPYCAAHAMRAIEPRSR